MDLVNVKFNVAVVFNSFTRNTLATASLFVYIY